MSDAIAIIRARHAAPATESGRWYGFAHDDVGMLLAHIDLLLAGLAECGRLAQTAEEILVSGERRRQEYDALVDRSLETSKEVLSLAARIMAREPGSSR